MCKQKIKAINHPTISKEIAYGKDNISKSIPANGAPCMLYRADTREISVIKRDGFSPRNPKSLDEVRLFIQDVCNNDTLTELNSWTISADSFGNIGVSTSDETSCCGYESKTSSKGYRYVIDTSSLKEVELTQEVLGINKIINNSIKKPRLYLDSNTLSEATIIGARPNSTSHEIVFFTTIPSSMIIGTLMDDDQHYQEI